MEMWLAIVGSGIVTYAARALPLVVRIPLPERGRARTYFDALPTSIIAALAGGAALAPDQHLVLGPEVPAAIVVIALTWWRRNLLLGVITGVALTAVLRVIA